MKVTMTVKVTIEVDDPDGYPDEYNTITRPTSKRERHVVMAYRRAVTEAKSEIVRTIEDETHLTAEMTDGRVDVER